MGISRHVSAKLSFEESTELFDQLVKVTQSVIEKVFEGRDQAPQPDRSRMKYVSMKFGELWLPRSTGILIGDLIVAREVEPELQNLGV